MCDCFCTLSQHETAMNFSVKEAKIGYWTPTMQISAAFFTAARVSAIDSSLCFPNLYPGKETSE